MLALLRFHHVVYYLLGGGIIALAFSALLNRDDQTAAQRLALSAEPPRAVAIDVFAPARHVGAAQEVRVLGRFAPALSAALRSGSKVAPLFAPGAETTDPPAAILLERADAPGGFERIATLDQAAEVDGLLVEGGEGFRTSVIEALAAFDIPQSTPVIAPFATTREEALTPKPARADAPLIAVFAGCALILYGIFRSWWTRRRR